MSWQKAAVAEAARVLREYPESSYEQVAEAMLRAVLPLIEVTPAMRDSGSPHCFGTNKQSRETLAEHCCQAMLTTCANEGQDGAR